MGTKLLKDFDGKSYVGWVDKLPLSDDDYYHVLYEDEDNEDFTIDEITPLIAAYRKKKKSIEGDKEAGTGKLKDSPKEPIPAINGTAEGAERSKRKRDLYNKSYKDDDDIDFTLQEETKPPPVKKKKSFDEDYVSIVDPQEESKSRSKNENVGNGATKGKLRRSRRRGAYTNGLEEEYKPSAMNEGDIIPCKKRPRRRRGAYNFQFEEEDDPSTSEDDVIPYNRPKKHNAIGSDIKKAVRNRDHSKVKKNSASIQLKERPRRSKSLYETQNDDNSEDSSPPDDKQMLRIEKGQTIDYVKTLRKRWAPKVHSNLFEIDLGTRLMKDFGGKNYLGWVIKLPSKTTKYYRVLYEDDDAEDFTIDEILPCIEAYDLNFKKVS